MKVAANRKTTAAPASSVGLVDAHVANTMACMWLGRQREFYEGAVMVQT
jgi:hypothetical protein